MFESDTDTSHLAKKINFFSPIARTMLTLGNDPDFVVPHNWKQSGSFTLLTTACFKSLTVVNELMDGKSG